MDGQSSLSSDGAARFVEIDGAPFGPEALQLVGECPAADGELLGRLGAVVVVLAEGAQDGVARVTGGSLRSAPATIVPPLRGNRGDAPSFLSLSRGVPPAVAS